LIIFFNFSPFFSVSWRKLFLSHSMCRLNDSISQVQPAGHISACRGHDEAVVVSFVTCHATVEAQIEVVVADKRIGPAQHLIFAPKHTAVLDAAVHQAALPMFQDALEHAHTLTADVWVVITTRGCNSTQTMQRALRLDRGVSMCF
jgi:hypothetical protein